MTALLCGCSLGNIGFDECDSSDACVLAFGLGSQCDAGFCTPASACVTAFDCHKTFGGGACVESTCRDTLPTHPQCPADHMEPPDLASQRLTGEPRTVIIGSMFSLEEDFDDALNTAVRLAVREINGVSGLNKGTQLAVVSCDNGGPENSIVGQERQQLNRNAIDFLSGTLGLTAIVGPTTSSDSLTSINHIIGKQYPTVLISPSATSPQLTVEPDRLESPNDAFGLFWRTCPSDELQGAVLADSVAGEFPEVSDVDKVSVLYIDDPYGLGLATVFKTTFEATAGQTAQLFPFDETTNWETKASEVDATGPDAVLMIAIKAERVISFMSEMAGNGLATKPIYLTDGSKDASKLLDPGLPEDVKDIIRNQTVGTAPASPTGGQFDAFDAALQNEFNIDAGDFAFLAQAYDATYSVGYGLVFATQDSIFVDGVDVASGLARLITGPQVPIGKNDWAVAKQALTSGDKQIDVQGVSGPLDFDPQLGEGPAPIEIWRPNADLDAFIVIDTVTPM